MDNPEVGAIFEKLKWTFAKSMPKNPHYYTLRKNWEDDALFCAVVMYIRKNGKKVMFGKTQYIILIIDGYRYWTMGCPLNRPDGSPYTRLINKAKEK